MAVYRTVIIKQHKHVDRPFTQSLCYHDGDLWESTGLYGESELRILDLHNSELIIREPVRLRSTRAVKVRYKKKPVSGLNDLTWRRGRLWANVYGSSAIVSIDPENGEVADLVDASTIQPNTTIDPMNVMNGLVAVPGSAKFLLTGKRWDLISEVIFQEIEDPAQARQFTDSVLSNNLDHFNQPSYTDRQEQGDRKAR